MIVNPPCPARPSPPPADVRSAVLALLTEAGVGESPSAQSFRRAVSVRRVRERLGGGNPATIGRAVNALEVELARTGVAQATLPELPPDIAELMQQLWQAAVGVQLDDLVRLRQEAQAVADGAREQLAEAQLRAEMLKQELGELQAALTDRDARLAQATADQAAQADRAASLQQQLDAVLARETTQRAENEELRAAHAAALAATQERYEGLTRQDLLAYRQALGQPVIEAETMATDRTRGASVLSQRSQARALAVVASLFGHWHDTGYLLGNPAAGLVGGARARAGFTPKRFVPPPLLQACDAWMGRGTPTAPSAEALRRWRQVAVWTVFRCAGVRLSELAWAADAGLPRLDVDERGGWTLRVLGKGDKERAIPLPQPCAQVLRDYRQARGLPALPGILERVPLIHGEKGSALGARGLYDEVKAVPLAVADEIEPGDAAGAQLLRAVSPHWLRHVYARTLVVDKGVPLPAAQALLGHASVQTTAEYAKTDLSKLREFVEQGFGDGTARSGSTS